MNTAIMINSPRTYRYEYVLIVVSSSDPAAGEEFEFETANQYGHTYVRYGTYVRTRWMPYRIAVLVLRVGFVPHQ